MLSSPLALTDSSALYQFVFTTDPFLQDPVPVGTAWVRYQINLFGDSDGKESACSAEDSGLIPGLRRAPWRREWLPTPVFLPGESHGQRSLAGYGPLGHKELDMTERLTL